MLKFQTKNEIEIYQAASGRCNSWLVHSEDFNIIVDTGIKKRSGDLLDSVTNILQDDQNIDLLFLTHTHFDHCRSAADLQRRKNCSIIMGKEEAVFVKEGFTPLPAGTFGLTKFISRLGSFIDSKRFHYEPFTPDILVKDERFVDRKYNLRAISTPGHSAGSVSLVINDEISIVGDVLLGKYDFTIFPPFADDKKELVKSWKKLLDTGCRFFLPGHSKPVSRDVLEKEYERYKNAW